MTTSLWGKFVIFLLAVIWSGTGWWIIISGGFTKSYKLSTTATYVDGPLAVVMAFLFFALSVTAAWVAVQSWKPTRLIYGAIAAGIVGPPALYLLLK